jgi:hypothetical protein
MCMFNWGLQLIKLTKNQKINNVMQQIGHFKLDLIINNLLFYLIIRNNDD